MRFRAKSVLESWSRILALGIIAALGFTRILWRLHFPLEFRGLSVILSFVAVLLVCYSFFAAFWEMDSEGLRQYRLPLINTKIHWQDVTRVGILRPSRYLSYKIEYNRRGIGPRTGRIWPIILADPERFLASLRRFAPQAEFVDESGRKTLPIRF